MDLKEIRSLIQLLHETRISEIEVEEKGRKIRVRQESSPGSLPSPALPFSPPVSSPLPSPVVAEEHPSFTVIPSPMVGTFYRTSSPDAEPYVNVGDRVKKGQTLCIVEAMKLMNEIESDLDGTVVKICVDDKSPVEYGQPLFHIQPVE